MREILEVVLGLLAASALISSFTGLAVLRRSRRANSLAPGLSSGAPLRWLWDPRRPARLHRRLRRACALSRAATASLDRPPAHGAGASYGTGAKGPSTSRSRQGRSGRWRRAEPARPSAMATAAEELVANAAALDRRLVLAYEQRGPWRRSSLSQVAKEVASIETSASRIAHLADSWQRNLDRQTAPAVPGVDLSSRLDAIESALHECETTTSK